MKTTSQILLIACLWILAVPAIAQTPACPEPSASADVWKQAQKSGLVVDVISEEEKAAPRPVLDNEYEIRPCQPDPQEDPARNKAEAERDARAEPILGS